ncbi:MAG: cobalamin B12-binding domain-containing protein [Candidatus Methanosuratus sp.]|nr:cobalamin B12-binding domain-containing protein [Candidatus Methanosuratincola sp.]
MVVSEETQLAEVLKQNVIKGDVKATESCVNKLLEMGLSARKIFDIISTGVLHMGEQLSNKEAFLPELVVTIDAFKKGLALIETKLKSEPKAGKPLRIVIGTVEGDIHNIGKNLVKTMLEVSGHDVYDLGVDIPADVFAAKAQEFDADIVGMSALVSPGLMSLRKTVERVRQVRGDRTNFIIGGYATSPALAEELNIMYAKDAIDAVNKIHDFVNRGGA